MYDQRNKIIGHCFVQFYSIGSLNAPVKKYVSSTTPEIPTTTNAISTSTKGSTVSTVQSWWNYLFSKNPGFQTHTVGPHWAHTHALVG